MSLHIPHAPTYAGQIPAALSAAGEELNARIDAANASRDRAAALQSEVFQEYRKNPPATDRRPVFRLLLQNAEAEAVLFEDLQVFDGAIREVFRRVHQEHVEQLAKIEERIKADANWPRGKHFPPELLRQNMEWVTAREKTLAYYDGNERFRQLEQCRLTALQDAARYRRLLAAEESRLNHIAEPKPQPPGDPIYDKRREEGARFQRRVGELLEETAAPRPTKRRKARS